MGFVFLSFQFVLGSKVRWIEGGIDLDKLFAIYRTTGKIGLVLILVHPNLLFISDIAFGLPDLITPRKLIGILALSVLIVAAGAALLYARLRLPNETWRAIHWANYIVLPLGPTHSLLLGSDLVRPPLRVFWYILAGLYVVILVHRLWRRIQVRRHPFQVVEVVQETYDIWSLHFEGEQVDYKPGQFLIVQLVRHKHAALHAR